MARRERTYNYIYKIIRLFDNKYYIGMHSTDNLDDGYFGSGKRIRYSIKKYGVDAHRKVIIEFLPTRQLLKQREREIVSRELITEADCLNIMEGGGGGFISDEQQSYRSHCGGVSFSKKLKEDIEFRKKHAECSSKNMKQNHKMGKMKYNTFNGKTHSDETKKKIGKLNALTQKGERNSQFGTCWITNGIENKKIKKTDIDYYFTSNWRFGRIAIGCIGKNQFTK
jgi:hypothetical protein